MQKNTQDILVEATNLSAGYGGKALWSGANFTIKPGEFVALLGPNGAGKTTLFRLLLGLGTPLKGSLKIFNETPRRGNPLIGYVPQRRPVDSEMRIEVAEFVRLGTSGTKWGFGSPSQTSAERKRSIEVLAMIDSAELAHRSIGELSGGELQRVFMAQALIGEPSLLLLDEPLANLDIRRENELVQLINQVTNEQKIAVMLIAHDINPLLKTVQKLIYIVNGKVASGTVGQIVTSKGLSDLYGVPVEVLHDSRGRVAVLGTEEAIHHE
jgi:zinc/manganese transport system ATP-binding protein